MTWTFHEDRPIYLQLIEKIQVKIITGYYPPGSRFPTVRELAMEASVNPNTMQKALSELERTGIITTYKTAGRSVTEDLDLIEQLKKQTAQTKMLAFLREMKDFGYGTTEIIHLLEEKAKEIL